MALGAIVTWNLLFKGVVGGLIIGLVAMGIVLVYRSSRVINFAVGNMGVPAVALFGVMVGAHGWPYWPSLVITLVLGTLVGVLIELVVIRRLFKAPRVIVFVATIGVAQLCEAVTLALPDYKTGSLQTQFPLPFTGTWHPGLDIEVTPSQILVLIVVPLVALGLWWLLGHTAFGDAVRAAATNSDLARMTGINPKLVSTGVWAIAGFLATMAVFLTATDQVSSDLVHIGPDTLLRGMAAALIGGMVSFPRAMLGGVIIGVLDRVLFFNYTSETGLVQFVLFIAVLVLVAVVSRRDATSAGESFQFAPRAAAVPERLKNIWWVKRLPQVVAGLALAVAVIAPIIVDKSERHQTWATIAAFALCAVSVVVLTGWGGQLSLGQMAFAGLGALTAAALIRGLQANIGWHSFRIIDGSIGGISFPWAMVLGACTASLMAVLVGVGALRVRGLLLAISTLAFAIAAQLYIFNRPFFTAGFSTVEIPRSDIGPFELTHRNRAYYYFVLFVLVLVLLLVGHLRRTGIGRIIVGVRENELAAAAMTVSPARAKLIAFAVGGFVAGLGGVLLGAVNLTFGPSERYFLVEDSIRLISIAVIGGLGSLSGAVVGALWVVGLPAFWPQNDLVPLFTSSIGLLLILLYIPGGFVQIGHYVRDSLLRWVDKRMGPVEQVKTVTAPPASLARAASRAPAQLNADGSVLATRELTVRFGGLVAVDHVDFHANPGEVIGLIGNNGAGKSTLLNAIGGFVPATGTVMLLGREVHKRNAQRRARAGLGRTFQAARLYPELTVRDTVQLALEARHRTGFWSSLLWLPSIKPERTKQREASELIDFLGLGRYADRFVAELSTGTRRIVELATVMAVAPRVICLDEPTAGVAQREAEAFGPLILRVQQELDATLVVVEHDLPLILSISDRVYCLEAGRVIAEGGPGEIRDNPRVVASYLGTDERAIQRSNA
ncbi:MAG TPA: branched-chain amino acid ABC transporter permease/ATP-binding protein [Acidimicrobiia bacterium]|jgi:ABC-type branched-subunit amino acid transport system ATPase component/ABC-type branched-subunit amino acid transport system permease subunit